MAEMKHYTTAPEDSISLAHKIIYGFGAFLNNLLAAAIGGMAIVLNLGLGMNPALVGLLGALPRLTDAVTDTVDGIHLRSYPHPLGQETALYLHRCHTPRYYLCPVMAVTLWGVSENYYFWFFLIGSFIFYLAYTVFATPWVALGYELTPDYHERTRLMGVQNFYGPAGLCYCTLVPVDNVRHGFLMTWSKVQLTSRSG